MRDNSFGTSLLLASDRPPYPPTTEGGHAGPHPPRDRDWLVPALKYAALAAFAGIVFHAALSSSKETGRLLRERNKVRAEIARLQQENMVREKILYALAADPFYVERVLRDRYGYRGLNEEEVTPPRRPAPDVAPGGTRAEAARARPAAYATTRRR